MQAAATLHGDPTLRAMAWPTPLCDERPVRKARRLWGVPFASLATTSMRAGMGVLSGGKLSAASTRAPSPLKVKKAASTSSILDTDSIMDSLGLAALAPQPMS
eukprot:scaffold3091_cov36-Tisochrysis_lutea.AAC.2